MNELVTIPLDYDKITLTKDQIGMDGIEIRLPVKRNAFLYNRRPAVPIQEEPKKHVNGVLL